MNTTALAIIFGMTTTFLISVTIFLFFLVLNLKIKSELPEVLKLEIEKNRNIYEFIRRRKFIKPENLVIELTKMHPKDPHYPQELARCRKELEERASGEYKSLSKIGGFFELSDNSKKYFIAESPTLKQLFTYFTKGSDALLIE